MINKIRDSFIGTKEFSTKLFNQIESLMFFKDSKIVILLENGGNKFSTNEEVISKTEAYFEAKEKLYDRPRIKLIRTYF
jgi:hypothetical protein